MKRASLIAAAFLAVAAFASASHADTVCSADNKDLAAPDSTATGVSVIIRFDPQSDTAKKIAADRRHFGSVLSSIAPSGISFDADFGRAVGSSVLTYMCHDPAIDLDEAVKRLQAQPGVVEVRPSLRMIAP